MADKKDRIERETLASQFGFALAFMNSNPELKKLFNQAVKQTWTPDRFVAGLRNTKWFKHHSASVRNAILQKTADPATYDANVDKMFSTVRDQWRGMFGGSTDFDRKDLKRWAETAYRMGWSESELVDRMTKGMSYQKVLRDRSIGGTAAEVKGQLESLTRSYGVNLGVPWRAKQMKNLLEGNDTIAGVQQRVKEMAMREYQAFAGEIQAGRTVTEILDPYKQKMAELLELNPGDIDITDRMIQTAAKQKTAKGTAAAMDLSAFEDFVRKDQRWQYTDNAREQVNSLTEGLLRQFGLVAG